jgi:hypothetical protein
MPRVQYIVGAIVLVFLILGIAAIVTVVNKKGYFLYKRNGDVKTIFEIEEGDPPIDTVFMKEVKGGFEAQYTITTKSGGGQLYKKADMPEYLMGVTPGLVYYISLQRNGEEFAKSRKFLWESFRKNPR